MKYMYYIVVSPHTLQTIEKPTSQFNSKWQLMPIKAIAKNGQKWSFVIPHIVKMSPEIYEGNTLTKNCQKLPKIAKMAKNYTKVSKITIFESTMIKMIFKKILPSLQHFKQLLFYDTHHNRQSKYLKQIPKSQV